MKLSNRLALTLAVAGLATSAFAQDSVSIHAALPGDALEVYDASETCNAYVLDMVAFQASWGTPLQIGPVLKSPRMPGSAFYNNLTSAHAISNDAISVDQFPVTTYQVWSTPGAGINGQNNSATGSMDVAGGGMQFGVTLADYGTSLDSSSYNGVHSAVVNYMPGEESRLYVYRTSTAVNGFDGTENRSQIGNGVIDASGNAHFRADDFGATGPNAIVGNNIFRTSVLGRDCGVLNVIDNAGGSDATTWIVVNNGTTFSVPSAMPESVAGRAVYGGGNFNSSYAYESTAGSFTTTTSHLQGADDHRGTMPFSPQPFFDMAGAVGTYGTLVYPAGASDADGVSIWDVDANGAPLLPGAQIVLPLSVSGGQGAITDNNDGYIIDGAIGAWHFDGYHSQTAYRGGTGTVSIRRTADGARYIAGTAYDNALGNYDNPANAVAVAKHDPNTGATEWTLAGYYDINTDTGKAIKDGPGGAVIGTMTGMFNVSGGSPLGPSISQTAFDCAGNIYFVAAAELYGDLGSDYDVVLLRAVLDPATFSYELELIAQSGDVFTGANSGTPYMITFMNLADGDSVDSGSFFAHNVVSDCWGGTAATDLDGNTDPRAVGGVLLNTRVTYDTDGDGLFDNTLDENYRALLLITGTGAASDPCDYADCNDDDAVNTQDFLCYLGLWSAGAAAADCDGNGTVNTQDFLCYLNLWTSCR